MENSLEVPPGPQVDSRGILEKGDIIETIPLSGSAATALVTFQDGSKAIFYPSADSLELAVFLIDKLLGFNLVPEVATRAVNEQQGMLRIFVGGAKPAVYYKTWNGMVHPEELQKAAVLDHILDSRDRRKENFLIDEDLHKLWLINNDRHMLLSSFDSREIFNTAINKGLTELSPDMLAAVDKFYSGVPAIIGQATEKEILDMLNSARERARVVLDKKSLANI